MRDDRLRLIVTCCHPALAPEARIALTLRLLAGLRTSEIGRAFLVSEAAMEQRLVRAKRKIRVTNLPYASPTPTSRRTGFVPCWPRSTSSSTRATPRPPATPWSVSS